MSGYTIARLAAAAEVHVETIRYYQRRGLLPVPPKAPGSIRRYGETHVERLRFIKHAQAVGFTLDEAADLLALRSRPGCRATRALAASRLEVLDQRLAQLQHWREELAQWISDCDANTSETDCPMIEHLKARS